MEFIGKHATFAFAVGLACAELTCTSKTRFLILNKKKKKANKSEKKQNKPCELKVSTGSCVCITLDKKPYFNDFLARGNIQDA